MLEANKILSENVTSDEEFYDTDIKGMADQSAGNFFAAYGAPLKGYQEKVVQELFADGKDDKGEPAPTMSITKSKDVVAGMLLPSQENIGAKQSLSNVAFGGGYTQGDGFDMSADDVGGAAYVKGSGYKYFTNPVMAARCKEGIMIIDGHHRWSQVMMLNPEATCDCVILEGTAAISSDDILQMVHVAIAEVAAGVVIKGEEMGQDAEARPTEKGNQKDVRKAAKKSFSPVKDKDGDFVYDEEEGLSTYGEITAGESQMGAVTAITGGPYSPTKPAKGDNLLTMEPSAAANNVVKFLKAGGNSPYNRGKIPQPLVEWANGRITAQDLANQTTGPGTGSKIPYAVEQKLGLTDITVEQFAEFLKGNIAECKKRGRVIKNRPTRKGMPQAGDMLGTEYSEKVLDHIANAKISIATSEASWHKGDALNESQARWQKLAGILKD